MNLDYFAAKTFVQFLSSKLNSRLCTKKKRGRRESIYQKNKIKNEENLKAGWISIRRFYRIGLQHFF